MNGTKTRPISRSSRSCTVKRPTKELTLCNYEPLGFMYLFRGIFLSYRTEVDRPLSTVSIEVRRVHGVDSPMRNKQRMGSHTLYLVIALNWLANIELMAYYPPRVRVPVGVIEKGWVEGGKVYRSTYAFRRQGSKSGPLPCRKGCGLRLNL